MAELSVLKRNPYFIPPDNELPHSPRTHYADWEAYHLPLARLHHTHLHGVGVVQGLTVAVPADDPATIEVTPGVALDRLGQVIVVAPTGQVDTSQREPGELEQAQSAPFRLRTAGRDAGRYALTIDFNEQLDFVSATLEQRPWLRLQPLTAEGTLADAASSVILALVTLDDDGVPTVVAADRTVQLARQVLGTQIQLRRATGQPGRVADQPTGGLRVTEEGALLLEADREVRFEQPSGDSLAQVALHSATLTTDGRIQAGALRVRDQALVGQLGVGTETPSKPLTVFDATLAQANLRTLTGELLLSVDSNGAHVATVSDHPLHLSVRGQAPVLTVTASGVGIGVTEPAARLHIGDALPAASDGALLLGPAAGASLRLGYAADHSWLQAEEPHPLAINPAGNAVGIGTTRPQAGLHVASNLVVGPFAIHDGQGGINATGAAAEVGFTSQALTAWPSTPQAGQRFVWYNPHESARLWTHGIGDLLTVTKEGELHFGTRIQQQINLWSREYGIGIQGWTQYFRTHGNFALYRGGLHHGDMLNAGGGVVQMALVNDNLGIGTTAPQQKLHVAGRFLLVNGAGNEQVYIGGDGAGNDIQWGSFNAGVVNAAVWNASTGTRMNLYVHDLRHTGRVIPPSDARLKTAITPLTGVLEKVAQIRGVSFDWTEEYRALDAQSCRREIGLIAQEVESIFPELVAPWNDQYKGVDYSRLTAVLLEAIKELTQRVRVLEGDLTP